LIHAGADFSNENSRLYSLIVGAYLHPPALTVWLGHISDTPWSLVRVFFFSNFIFPPVIFLLAVIVNLRLQQRAAMGAAIRWIMLSGLALFLFINLAPPYKGWQFRGSGLARIYQPLFGAMLVFTLIVIQRMSERRSRLPEAKPVACLFAALSLLNASIVMGPATKNPLAAWTYWKFYNHASRPMMNENLVLFGRRPLGFCNTRIKIDNPPPRILGAARHNKPPLEQRRKTKAQLLREQHQKAAQPKVRPKKKRAATSPSASPPTTAPAADPSARAVVAALCRDG
jgi:hypothetical protein